MKRLRQYPIILFFSLLFSAAIACQLGGSQPAAEIDTDAIVQEAVATIEAQQPEPAAVSVVTDSAMEGMDSALQDALIGIYRQVNPAVVHIRVFADEQELAIPLGAGSGFVYDSEGHIITNNHVVTDGDSFEVVFADGSHSEAVVVGTDVDSDLAVIKAKQLPDGVQPVSLADSSAVQVGQFAVAIGNPFDETGSMSVGIISGLGRTMQSQRVADGGGRYSLPQVIQTDAAINPGNSGGPLLNLDGEVIGVNSAILTRTGTNSGVGFSIPVNAVRRIAPALIADGSYTYPFIGIRMLSLDIALQEEVEAPQTAGAYITEVTDGAPADEAGLIGREGPGGDLIVAINGQSIVDSDDLISYLVFETEVGQTVNLTVIRNKEEMIIPLTLGARP
ncbi:MAG: trypsin-like serine protease [Chloroflexi bacterium]|nr:trypsin-like serine protease [Chloroflexota bacterium]